MATEIVSNEDAPSTSQGLPLGGLGLHPAEPQLDLEQQWQDIMAIMELQVCSPPTLMTHSLQYNVAEPKVFVHVRNKNPVKNEDYTWKVPPRTFEVCYTSIHLATAGCPITQGSAAPHPYPSLSLCPWARPFTHIASVRGAVWCLYRAAVATHHVA